MSDVILRTAQPFEGPYDTPTRQTHSKRFAHTAED